MGGGEGLVPPRVAVELLDLIETPSKATMTRECASDGDAHLFYGTECSIGLQSLEPNELQRKLTEEIYTRSIYEEQALHKYSVDTPRGS